MFCKYCGFKLDDDAQFCPSCGKKVTDKKEGKKHDSSYDISYDNHVNTKSINIVVTIIIGIVLLAVIAFLVFNVFLKNNTSTSDATATSIKETIAQDEYGRLIYTDENGKLKFNTWIKYDGAEYYVDDDGFVMRDAWIDNEYYVDSDGKKVKNEWHVDKNSGAYYYLGTDGKYIKSTIQTIDSKKYYFFDNGIMAKAQIVPDFKDSKKMMYASEDGSLVEKEGDYTIQGKKYHIGNDGYIVMPTTTSQQVPQTTQSAQTAVTPQVVQENGTYDLASLYKKIQSAKIATQTSNYQNVNSFDTVKFGHFEQDNNPANGAETVEWIVLEKNAQTQTALLWSKYILDQSSLNGVKAWLNNFYINSFSNEDKMFVVNNEYENYGFTNMSVLGPNELKRYYFYNQGLDKYYNYETLATQYAIAKGVAVNQGAFGAYWYEVENKGQFLSPAGFSPSKDKIGVRPCIMVKYTGTVTEIGGTNTSGSSSQSSGGVLSIDSYDSIDDDLYWGEDDAKVTYTAKMPVFKGGTENELEIIQEGIQEMMDTLSGFAEDYVSRSNVKVKKIAFSKPTTKTLDSKNVVLEFTGAISLGGASGQTVKYTFSFNREDLDYKITRTQ